MLIVASVTEAVTDCPGVKVNLVKVNATWSGAPCVLKALNPPAPSSPRLDTVTVKVPEEPTGIVMNWTLVEMSKSPFTAMVKLRTCVIPVPVAVKART